MKDYASIQTYYSGVFPDVVAVDSSGAATTDGTEYIAAQINNGIFGWQQDIMDYAGLSPDGTIEAAGTGQIKEAFQKGNGIGPGMYVQRAIDDTPAVHGDRVILLTSAMQGVLIATYPELVAAVYVGDANNATAPYFYKSTDAAGLTRNVAGTYIQLPPRPDGGMLLKQYSQAAGDFTISTPATWTTQASSLVPYKTSDGSIFMDFNLYGSVTALSSISMVIPGVTIAADFRNPFSALDQAFARIKEQTRAYDNAGAATFQVTFPGTVNGVHMNGTVKLASWPTWADDFEYQWGITY